MTCGILTEIGVSPGMCESATSRFIFSKESCRINIVLLEEMKYHWICGILQEERVVHILLLRSGRSGSAWRHKKDLVSPRFKPVLPEAYHFLLIYGYASFVNRGRLICQDIGFLALKQDISLGREATLSHHSSHHSTQVYQIKHEFPALTRQD